MLSRFWVELAAHVERAGLPLRRIAARADIPHQTLFNWTKGTQPRWHPALAADLTRLAAALELDPTSTERLLQAAGCLPFTRHDRGREDHMAQTLPKYWFPAGTQPGDYEMGISEAEDNAGRRFAFVRSGENPRGFGTLMQVFAADDYRGKRLRLRAEVKALAVEHWAALWMRVDGRWPTEMLAFDNMQDRPITGSTEWRQHDVVLDVAPAATQVAFGVLLSGIGEVRIADVEITPVSNDVAATHSETYPSAPMNLDFAL